MLRLLTLLIIIPISCATAWAQIPDNSLDKFKKIPANYVSVVNKKVTTYTNQLSSKTKKTLTKLSHYENKIHGILQKVNPEADNKLFGNNQPTFTSLLNQLKQGEAVTQEYQGTYDKYQDELSTRLKYIAQQKKQINSSQVMKATATGKKMNLLANEEDKSAALEAFIKDRKKQLWQQAIQQAGTNKYLGEISKESFYYTETIKNYKEIFSDTKKVEETTQTLLNKIPAFKQFMQQNSQLATIFGQQGSAGTAQVIPGLQTRVQMESQVQNQIEAAGTGGSDVISQNLQEAKTQLGKLKEKLQGASAAPIEELPRFKPKMEKTRTFLQRLEYGPSFQFGQTNNLIPASADLGLTIGYKLNSKSTIGIGGSYKLGLGTISRIRFTGQGAGIKSYLDWKLKNSLFVSGGFEMNYLSKLPLLLQPFSAWQKSALLGLSKKIPVKSKWCKGTNVQLLYDFLSQQHLPSSQPLIFRVGYTI